MCWGWPGVIPWTRSHLQRDTNTPKSRRRPYLQKTWAIEGENLRGKLLFRKQSPPHPTSPTLAYLLWFLDLGAMLGGVHSFVHLFVCSLPHLRRQNPHLSLILVQPAPQCDHNDCCSSFLPHPLRGLLCSPATSSPAEGPLLLRHQAGPGVPLAMVLARLLDSVFA